MEVEVLREKLHEYINTADEQHLSAIYTLVEENIPTIPDSKYNEATLAMFYQRREDHINGVSKSYSVDEAMNIIRQQIK